MSVAADVELIRLRRENFNLTERLKEANEDRVFFLELLVKREQQIIDIKAALGDDALPEHPGVTAFRREMRRGMEQKDWLAPRPANPSATTNTTDEVQA